MSRQWSSLLGSTLLGKHGTLAISAHGIALRQFNKPAQLLTGPTFQWTDANQLNDVLTLHQQLLKNQTLNIVLSNAFVRFLVLPWQDGVFTQQDWQAIAQHEFRKQFGVIANNWRITVSLHGYGQTVLAAAIDESLCAQLYSSAQQLQFDIAAITPLLMVLSNTHSASQQAHTDHTWLLMAEPARLTLCQFSQGNWQQVLADVPLAGLEYQHAEQLINRSLLYVDANNQPSKIATYVSASLNKTWRDDIGSRLKLMTHTTSTQPHAMWMAGLKFTASVSVFSAHKINLNFASNAQPKASLWAWLGLLVGLVLLALLLLQYQAAQVNIQQLEALSSQNAIAPMRTIVDPLLDDQLKFAAIAQQQLNLPWLPMLAALEAVKAENPNIELLNISPNKSRAEIKLTGEAEVFSDITKLLDDLRINPAFTDAVLLNQHLEQDKSKLLYVFEINIGWRI